VTPRAGGHATRLVLLAVSFALFAAGLRAAGGKPLLQHTPYDQHTLQALAWLEGHVDVVGDPERLELAEYQGRQFNSFPPTPSLLQLPLVLVFGRDTPSLLLLYAAALVAILAQHAVIRRLGGSDLWAGLLSIGLVFGSNLFPSIIQGGVWSEGQVIGYSLAVLGIERQVKNPRRGLGGPGLGYFLLSLAVGCRPFYLFLLPLCLVIDHETNQRPYRAALGDAVLFMAPYTALLGGYNALRFGNPLEFGHNYLPWARELEHGIFSIHYLARNIDHAILRLPRLGRPQRFLQFDPHGTAFWLNNGLLLLGMFRLAGRDLSRPMRLSAGFTLATTMLSLLLHETNGYFQVGWRFAIDLLPVGFWLLAAARGAWNPVVIGLVPASILLNLYAVWWFQVAMQEA